jgi:hypothetical protein
MEYSHRNLLHPYNQPEKTDELKSTISCQNLNMLDSIPSAAKLEVLQLNCRIAKNRRDELNTHLTKSTG